MRPIAQADRGQQLIDPFPRLGSRSSVEAQ